MTVVTHIAAVSDDSEIVRYGQVSAIAANSSCIGNLAASLTKADINVEVSDLRGFLRRSLDCWV